MKRLSVEGEAWLFDKAKKSRNAAWLKAFLRYKSYWDLVFLARVLLGYDKICDPYHYYLADWVWGPNPLKFCAAVRKSYKSVLLNTSYCLQRMIRDHNIEIMQAGADIGVVGSRVREIRSHLDSNPRFRAVWGDWVSLNDWSEKRFTISVRDQIRNDPTMGMATPGMPKTSKHPQLIVCDDLEAKENSDYELEREAAKSFFSAQFGLLKPGGEFLGLNAPWHFDNVTFGRVLTRREPYHYWELMDLCVLPVEHGEGENRFFVMPSVFDEAGIKRELQLVGYEAMMCQYYLWPVGKGDARFNRALTKDRLFSVVPEGLATCCIVDPSGDSKSTSDPAAIGVFGFDEKGVLYVLDAREYKLEPNALCRKAIEIARSWKCPRLAVECSSQTLGYMSLMRDAMAFLGGVPLKVHKLDPRERGAKGPHIAWLIGLWDRDMMKVNAACRAFIQQLETYSGSERGNTSGPDDMLDIAAYSKDVPGFKPPKPEAILTPQEQDRMARRKSEMDFAQGMMSDRRDRRHIEYAGGIPGYMWQ